MQCKTEGGSWRDPFSPLCSLKQVYFVLTSFADRIPVFTLRTGETLQFSAQVEAKTLEYKVSNHKAHGT
jgi:hypothetical protein